MAHWKFIAAEAKGLYFIAHNSKDMSVVKLFYFRRWFPTQTDFQLRKFDNLTKFSNVIIATADVEFF